MRREPGVFAGQDPAIVRHELPQQINILEIERVDGEVNLGFGPGCSFLEATGAAAAFAFSAVGVSFAGHKGADPGWLLDFLVDSAPAEEGVVFFDLQFLRLQFLIARGGVARGRFAFFAGLGAFDGDDFARHRGSVKRVQ